MARLPRAAKTLIKQVQVLHPDAEWRRSGPPDGFSTHRSITFDAAMTAWLEPVLQAHVGQRIKSVEVVDGELRVTFTHTVESEDPKPFMLDEVLAILSQPEDQDMKVTTAGESLDLGADPDSEIVQEWTASEFFEPGVSSGRRGSAARGHTASAAAAEESE